MSTGVNTLAAPADYFDVGIDRANRVIAQDLAYPMNPQARALQPPPNGVYSSLDELLLQANGHAVAHGYKFVVVRSKTNTAGHKTWVHLACDRHGAS